MSWVKVSYISVNGSQIAAKQHAFYDAWTNTLKMCIYRWKAAFSSGTNALYEVLGKQLIFEAPSPRCSEREMCLLVSGSSCFQSGVKEQFWLIIKSQRAHTLIKKRCFMKVSAFVSLKRTKVYEQLLLPYARFHFLLPITIRNHGIKMYITNCLIFSQSPLILPPKKTGLLT